MGEYKYIELIFENCNTVKLKPSDIIHLNMGGITENAWGNSAEQFAVGKTCSHFCLVITKKSRKTKTSFETEQNCKESFEDHLKTFRDITGVNIIREGVDDFFVGVPYDDENENQLGSPNRLCKITYLDEDEFSSGQIHIEINETT